MIQFYSFIILLIVDICEFASGISFNQSKFELFSSWNTNATTFADETFIGQLSTSIFINNQNHRLLLWLNESIDQIISEELINPWSIFVTNKNEIIVDNGYINRTVNRNHTIVMYINSSCTGFFVDIFDAAYCSLADEHQVIKSQMIVAGTGCPRPIANMLDHPHGIYSHPNQSEIILESNLYGTKLSCIEEKFQLNTHEKVNKVEIRVNSNTDLLIKDIRLFTIHGRSSESIAGVGSGNIFSKQFENYTVGYVTGRSGIQLDQIQFHWYATV